MEQPIPELRAAGCGRAWGVVKQGIYFISKEDKPEQTIKFFSFATRRVTPLLTVDNDSLTSPTSLVMSPDGRWLLYTRVDHSVNDLMMMENFR